MQFCAAPQQCFGNDDVGPCSQRAVAKGGRNIVDRTRNRGMRRLVAAVDADNAAVAKAARGGVPVKPAGLVATTFKNKPELAQRRCVILKRLRRVPHCLGQ